jgi:hypothetical protein
VSAQGIEERGHRSRLSDACCSETSTAQYIIYNINRAAWNSRCPAKTPRQSCPGVPLPLPRPTKKKINNPPKNVSPSNLPSPVHCPRDRSHRQAPIRESSASDPCKGFPPKTSKRPRVDAIKNAPVDPSCHRAGTSRARSNSLPRRNATATCARAMGQDYPFTGPSPGANPPIYSSSLPRALSPLLSSLFINALSPYLTDIGRKKRIHHGLPGTHPFNHILFADYMTLLAQDSEGMQTLLNAIQQFEEWSGIPVNTMKTK